MGEMADLADARGSERTSTQSFGSYCEARPATLITGASRGIGLALAHEFAEQGHELMLVARDLDALERLRIELSTAYAARVHLASLDLSQPHAWKDLHAAVGHHGLYVENLVNNVGMGLAGPLREANVEELLVLIDLNVRAATGLTAAFLPDMVRRGSGSILNVGSMGGAAPLPFMATYGASKSYLLSWSRALNAELKGSGVHVSVLMPGVVHTGMAADMKLLRPGALSLLPKHTPASVARVAYDGLFLRQPVILPGLINRIGRLVLQVMPYRLVEIFLRRILTP